MSAGVGEMISVGLGELKVAKNGSAVMACLGLGSCVGVAVYDPVAKVAGMAHVVLPEAPAGQRDGNAKFADTGVPRLFEKVRRLGAANGRLVVKIAGGAQMALAGAHDPVFKIGARNVEATVAAMKKEGIGIAAREIGGNRGRTMRLDLATGTVTVASAGTGSREL